MSAIEVTSVRTKTAVQPGIDQRLRRRLAGVRVDVGDHHPRTALGEGAGAGRADPHRRPGDDRYPSVEILCRHVTRL